MDYKIYINYHSGRANSNEYGTSRAAMKVMREHSSGIMKFSQKIQLAMK